MEVVGKMPLTAELAAQHINDRLKDLTGLVKEIDEERYKNESNIDNLYKARDRMEMEERSSQYCQQKLKNLYKDIQVDTITEEELIRQALSKIHEIRQIRNERRIQARNAGNKETIRRGALMKMLQSSAITLPLFVSRMGEKAPPLCGAVPADNNYVAKPGDMVAALVKGSDAEENWILAEVVSWNGAINKYEVDDIDEEQKDRHVLSRRRIVPLPLMRANPETDSLALFPKNSTVMALYPQTTCFYKAIINDFPKISTDEYEVLFEDPSYAEGYSPPLCVAQRYVIAIKQNKGKMA